MGPFPRPTSGARRIGAIPLCVPLAMFAMLACACTRPTSSDPPAVAVPSPPSATRLVVPSGAADGGGPPATLIDAAPDAEVIAPVLAPRIEVDGPHEILLAPGRPIYFARPRRVVVPADAGADAGAEPPARLIGHLHGICGPPSYACGKWLLAGVEQGTLVCPTGNAHCGDSPMGPPSWEAPTWQELVTQMDADLEKSVARVEGAKRGSIRREGAVLTGYSRGAYAAAVIARMRPGRWPFLVLIEANVPLAAASLRKAGVRAVALVAGELGSEIAGERKTADALTKDGFPAKLFVMPKTGHLYSDDMEQIMREALAFVLSFESAGSASQE